MNLLVRLSMYCACGIRGKTDSVSNILGCLVTVYFLFKYVGRQKLKHICEYVNNNILAM